MNPTSTDAGLKIKTEVRKSSVPGGGSARYVLERVPKGTVVRRTKLVEVNSNNIQKFEAKPGLTVTATDLKSLLAAMNYDDVEGLPSNTEQIIHFCGTPTGLTPENDSTFHWVPSNFFNHSAKPNVDIVLPNKACPEYVDVIATRDIEVGEELFQDYRLFHNPEWFRKYAKNTVGILDTQSLGFQISG